MHINKVLKTTANPKMKKLKTNYKN